MTVGGAGVGDGGGVPGGGGAGVGVPGGGGAGDGVPGAGGGDVRGVSGAGVRSAGVRSADVRSAGVRGTLGRPGEFVAPGECGDVVVGRGGAGGGQTGSSESRASWPIWLMASSSEPVGRPASTW